MGVQLMQNGLLINNFKVTSINKQVVSTIVRLCTGLCMIVLWPCLTKYLYPFNVMGVQLVQNGLLINNFTFTSTNKHVVRTIVRLCTGLCMIVLWPHLSRSICTHSMLRVFSQCRMAYFNNFTFTSINKHVVNTIVELCKIVLCCFGYIFVFGPVQSYVQSLQAWCGEGGVGRYRSITHIMVLPLNHSIVIIIPLLIISYRGITI